MSWKNEHGPDFEVPGVISNMVKDGILKDISWHNDSMPRFVIEDPDDEDNGVCLWVDHPIGEQREHGSGGKRFMVSANGLVADPVDVLETDDLEEALKTLAEYQEKHIDKLEPLDIGDLIKDWIKSLRR